MKFVEICYAPIFKLKGVEKFLQGLAAVRFKIPKSVVQVEKKVFILHGANYEL